MGVYLCAKFEVSSIILTGFRQGVIYLPPLHTHTPQPPKKRTKIRVNAFLMKHATFVALT